MKRGFSIGLSTKFAIFAQRLVFAGMVVGLLPWESLVLAVNNDGKADIYWRNYASGDDAGWTMNGVSYVSSVAMAWQGDTNWTMVATGDFNNHGELDLLWRNVNTGMNVVWFVCAGNFMGATYLQALADTNWEVVGTGYFDGGTDKNIDILWRNKSTGDNAIWFMSGPTLVSTTLIQEVPDLNWKVGGTGDFNNDGYTDIVWHHATTGANAVWYMQGGGFVTTALVQSASDLNWEIVGTGYFTGANDNTIDLLWRNTSTGDNAIWQMSGVSFVSSHLLPWAALDWKVGGTGDAKVDTDGDGLPDIWERRFFSDLSATSSGDPDADGQSNSTEYENGSNPMISNTLQNIGNAVENNVLSWTSGGSAGWVYCTTSSYTNGNSAKSGAIGNWRDSWLRTEVMGPGTFSFRWRTSSQSNSDILRIPFWGPDGSAGTGGQYSGIYSSFQQQSISLLPGLNTIMFIYEKDGSGASGEDAAYIDNVQYTFWGDNSNATNSLAEAVDDMGRTYRCDSPWGVSWFRQTNVYHDGGDSAQSGAPGDGNSSWLVTQVTGPGILSFYWRVDSEEGYDFLHFQVDGAEQDSDSGERNWELKVYSIPVGTHTLAWIYSKDESDSQGQDAGWVDNVRFVQDSDTDGLGDSWEIQYFGNTTSQNGTGDSDADGSNNLQEYLNGTNPTLAELRVKILTPRKYSMLP